MQKKLSSFNSQFQFQGKSASGLIGCEREFFIQTLEGNLVPMAAVLYPHLESFGCGYELSACQLEMRVGPDSLGTFQESIRRIRESVESECERYGFKTCFDSIAPDNMALDVYPDPTGRYAAISSALPREKLLAACRITGTHVHIGMPDMDTAIRVHDGLIDHVEDLLEEADLTEGKRLGIYKIVTPDYLPQRFDSPQKMLDMYLAAGCGEDPRSWWRLIRISKHGTIEFRMFDNTSDDHQVFLWGKKCHELCMAFMQ